MNGKMFFVCCLLLLLGGPAVAQVQPVVTVGSATATVNQTTPILVPVTGSNLVRLTEWTLKVSYDRSRLVFAGVTKGTATASWFYVDGSVTSNRVQLIGRSGPAGLAVNGANQQLCVIRFYPKPDAYATTVTLNPSNPGGEIRRASLVPGKIQITSLPPMKLNIGEAKGAAGTTVSLPATVNWLNGSTAWGFELNFDKKRLGFVSVLKGAATRNWTTLTGKPSTGKVKISASAGSGAALNGTNLELCKIVLKITTGTAVNTVLRPEPKKPSIGLNGARLDRGKVTVIAPTPTPTPRPTATPTPTPTPTPTATPTPTPTATPTSRARRR